MGLADAWHRPSLYLQAPDLDNKRTQCVANPEEGARGSYRGMQGKPAGARARRCASQQVPATPGKIFQLSPWHSLPYHWV